MRVLRRLPAVLAVAVASLSVVALQSAAYSLDSSSAGPSVRAASARGSVVIQPAAGRRPASDVAELEDLQSYFDHEGVGGTDAARRIVSAQGPFTQLAGVLAEQYPDQYSDAAFTPDGDVGGWISFTTEPSQEILDEVATLPVPVEVRWGASATAEELASAVEIAMAVVSTAIEDAGPAVTYIDPQANTLTIEYSSGIAAARSAAPTAGAIEDAVSRAIADQSADGLLPTDVVVRETPNGGAVEYRELFGGAQLRRASTGDLECTAGFTATRKGDDGLITADHCVDKLHFGRSSGQIQFVSAASKTAAGNWIDLQFHRAIGDAYATSKFRVTDGGGYRYLISAADPVKGDWVCRYGMTSGYSCDSTYATQLCYKPSDKNYCGLFATTHNYATFGDSGGPVFFGSSARGYTTGAQTISGAWRTLSTAVTMGSKYLDAVTIK